MHHIYITQYCSRICHFHFRNVSIIRFSGRTVNLFSRTRRIFHTCVPGLISPVAVENITLPLLTLSTNSDNNCRAKRQSLIWLRLKEERFLCQIPRLVIIILIEKLCQQANSPKTPPSPAPRRAANTKQSLRLRKRPSTSSDSQRSTQIGLQSERRSLSNGLPIPLTQQKIVHTLRAAV